MVMIRDTPLAPNLKSKEIRLRTNWSLKEWEINLVNKIMPITVDGLKTNQNLIKHNGLNCLSENKWMQEKQGKRMSNFNFNLTSW